MICAGCHHESGRPELHRLLLHCQGDTLSKIKPILTPGSAVTTGKNEVDMIVTEYGIARLRGRSMSQRVKALISIAHPKFRDELTFEAKQRNMII